MKLYFGPGTCALAPHIALEEVGATFEPVRLDFSKAEQRGAEYLAINPKGRVPSLVTDRGTLTEVPAILAFIAETYPAAKLAPQGDPFAFARLQAFTVYLCSTVHVAHAHNVRGSRWADDPAAIAEMKRKAPESVGACYELIEREMFAGPWVMGGAYTVADPYLFTTSRWLGRDGVDIARFPKIKDHFARMSERPAVKRALALHQP